jgi:phospholipid/cholesterol/gamma-HCH transport system permease protein
MTKLINYILSPIIIFFESIGEYLLLISKIFRSSESWDKYLPNILDQMILIGTKSLPIVIITSLFSGMVTSVQGAYQMTTSLVPKWYLGGIVGESVILELAPVITGLVMAGKVGANIAAEIGTMRVTEQIDALETLSLDPVAYLIFPRIVAGIVMFPVLIIIADFFGIFGGAFACMTSLDINLYQFLKGLKSWFNPWDATFGIIKAISFGFAVTSIASYFGYYTKGGAAGVGKATTSTVVVSCVTILILDYLLAEILL